MFYKLLLLFILFISQFSYSQKTEENPPRQSLYKQIVQMDSLLFSVAFNQCDLEIYKKIMSPDLEFYDDRSGLNTSIEKEIASFKDRCSKPFKVTRNLVNTSVHVLGDYGAVQLGEHNFLVDDKVVENAMFITIWERRENSWIVKRAVSYDHKSVK